MHIIAATFFTAGWCVNIHFRRWDQSNASVPGDHGAWFWSNIQSSFLTDYFHTCVILIIACYFSIKAFTFDEIGSVGHLYDLVKAAAARHPVAGNHDGTYLTMTSKGVSDYYMDRVLGLSW